MKKKPIKKSIVSLFILTLFWPLPILLLALLNITSQNLQSIVSSLPVVFSIIMLGKQIILNQSIPHIRNAFFFYTSFFLLLFSIILSSINGGVGLISLIAALKTIGQLSLFFFWSSVILNKSTQIQKKNILDYYFKLCLIPVSSITIEMLLKLISLNFMLNVYDVAQKAGFSGTNYLAYGDLPFEIFSGHSTRALGFYFDMLTTPALAYLSLIYFSWTNNWRLAILCLLNLILSFRLTMIIPGILLFIMVASKRYYRSIFYAFCIGAFIFGSLIISSLKDFASPATILEHLFGHLPLLLNRPIADIILGSGYNRSEESVVGYSEVFLWRFFEYFGLLGITSIIFIISFLFIKGLKKPIFSPEKSDLKSDFPRLSLGLAALFLPLVLHYNMFFIGPIILGYALLIAFILSKDYQPIDYSYGGEKATELL